jgi:hypothetical protein
MNTKESKLEVQQEQLDIPVVTRRTLCNKYFEGYNNTSHRAGFGLQNFVTNGYIEPLVKYLESKGVKVNP